MGLLDNTIINSELVKVNSAYSDSTEALNGTSSMLLKQGLVKESFQEAIIDREIKFPTGLNFNGVGIAIPHTDSEHVIKQSIALNLLREPVDFIEMATECEKVNVSLIVMLAVKDISNQVLFLQALMELFQNNEIAESLLNSNSSQELVENFIKKINEVNL